MLCAADHKNLEHSMHPISLSCRDFLGFPDKKHKLYVRGDCVQNTHTNIGEIPHFMVEKLNKKKNSNSFYCCFLQLLVFTLYGQKSGKLHHC